MKFEWVRGLPPLNFARVPPATGAPHGMSSPPSLTKGSLVWAKLPAFPWWPAQVTDVTGSDVHVTFCGTGDLGTASRADVVPYGSRLSLRETKQKDRWKKKFKHAVGEADQRPAVFSLTA